MWRLMEYSWPEIVTLPSIELRLGVFAAAEGSKFLDSILK